MKLIYVAGRIRAPDAWLIHRNVFEAECAAREIVNLGAAPLCPHSIGARFHGTATEEFWLEVTSELLKRSDAVLVLPDYESSKGTLREIETASKAGIPVFMPQVLPMVSGPDYVALRYWLSVKS